MASPQVGLAFSDDALVSSVNPLFQLDDVVYIKSEYVNSTNDDFDYNPHKVVDIFIKDDGTDVVGANGVALADSGVAADLSTTDEDTTNDTNLLYPFFYKIQQVDSAGAATGIKPQDVHETNLKTLAGVKARVGAASATWTDPV